MWNLFVVSVKKKKEINILQHAREKKKKRNMERKKKYSKTCFFLL